MTGKTIVILQSNYLPWKGYFDLMAAADEFLLFDEVQFTKNDWRNRNRIRTGQGTQWLTIPVVTSGRFGQTVAEAEVVQGDWAAKHWKALAQNYAHAPFFGAYAHTLERAFAECAALSHLSAVNRRLIEVTAGLLGITTPLTDATRYAFSGDRNGRLVTLCQSAAATHYLTGPSARDYLDLDLFARAGIAVRFMDYSGYEPYPQVHGGFEGDVSALDLLFNTGPEARGHLQCRNGRDWA